MTFFTMYHEEFAPKFDIKNTSSALAWNFGQLPLRPIPYQITLPQTHTKNLDMKSVYENTLLHGFERKKARIIKSNRISKQFTYHD